MISFSESLLLFTVVLTPIYLATLVFSDKNGKARPAHLTSSTKLKLAPMAMVSLVLLTFALLHIPEFKAGSNYLLLVPFITMLLLYVLRMKRDLGAFRGLILFSMLLFHIIILYAPPFGIILAERSPALARMSIEGFYDPSRPLLGPTYNPFPMDLGLLLMFTEVTGFSPIAKFSEWLISLSLILVIDFTLYSLVMRLTGNWAAGALTILIFAITPPVNFIEHHSKLAGLMLVLLATFMLALEFKGGVSPWKTSTAVLAYTVGIFYHPTAGLMMFVVAGILAAGFLLKRFMREREWEEMFKSRIFRIALVTFIVITLTRWMYGGGFEFPIVPSIRNYLLQMLELERESGMPAPLYERAEVSPIQAYAWSTPVAMAGSLILYIVIRRRSRCGALVPSLAVGSGSFLLIGFLGGYFRAGGFAASMYPGFGIVMPAAALVAWKALHSSRISAVFLVVLLTASVAVAVRDPMLSPIGWAAELRGTPEGGEEQYFIGSTLLSITPSEKNMKTPYEIIHSVLYLNPYAKVRQFVGEPRDPKYYRDYELLLKGYIEADTLYVLRSEQVPPHLMGANSSQIDILFTAGGYVGFVKSG